MAGLMAASAYAQQPPTPARQPATPPLTASPAPAPEVPPGKPAAAQKEDAVPPDKVVLKVGDQSATAADLDYFISRVPQKTQQSLQSEGQGRRLLGDDYATRMALAQQALGDHLDQDPGFVRQMAFARLDGLAKAEYEKLEAQMTASPEEISQYYTAHLSDFETMDIRRIMFRVKPPGSQPQTPGLDRNEAKARIEAVRKELLAGKDPTEIEKELKNAKEGFLDVKPRSVRTAEFLGQIAAQWRAEVPKLKEGEITEVLDAGRQGYAALQVVKRGHQELKDATKEIEEQIRYEKLRVRVEEVKKKAGIWMDDAYFKLPAPAPQPQSKPAPAPAPPAPSAKQ